VTSEATAADVKDANASTPRLFGKIVGSATGILTVIVFILIFVFRYWTEIRDARGSHTRTQDTPADAIRFDGNGNLVDGMSTKGDSRVSVTSASSRLRIPTLDGSLGAHHHLTDRDLV
jgi:hypothetical protein